MARFNCAVVAAENRGPAAALAALDELATDERLALYQPYWAARAEMLASCGARAAAQAAYVQAIGLERNPAVRLFLQQRAAEVAAKSR